MTAADRHAAGEADRRIAQLIQFGTVREVDLSRARVRIALGGDAVSAWVPWVAGRAGDTRIYSAPSVGEQVVLLSPSGNSAQGVALLGVYSASSGAPSTNPAATVIELAGGVTIAVEGGAVQLVAPGGISVQGDVTVQGDVIANGISLTSHVHSGVMPGGGQTGAPVG